MSRRAELARQIAGTTHEPMCRAWIDYLREVRASLIEAMIIADDGAPRDAEAHRLQIIDEVLSEVQRPR